MGIIFRKWSDHDSLFPIFAVIIFFVMYSSTTEFGAEEVKGALARRISSAGLDNHAVNQPVDFGWYGAG